MATPSVTTTPEPRDGLPVSAEGSPKPSDEITAVMCALDGMSGVLTELVDGADARIDRVAYTCADHLKRLSDSLERALPAVKQMEGQP